MVSAWKIALEQLIAVFASDVSRAVMIFLLVDGCNSWNNLIVCLLCSELDIQFQASHKSLVGLF